MFDDSHDQPEAPGASAVRERFDRRYILLALAPLGAYVLLYLSIEAMRNMGIEFRTIHAFQFVEVAASETKYRYLWVSAFLVSAAVTVAVIAAAGFSLLAQTPRRDRRLVWSLIALIVGVITLYEGYGVSCATPQGEGPPVGLCGALQNDWWYESLGKDLYQETLGRLPITADPLAVPVADFEDSALARLESALVALKFLGTLALVLIAAGSILTLTRPEAAGPRDSAVAAVQAEFLAGKVALLRRYLYLGSAAYVFAIIAMISWMLWPLPFLDGAQARSDYHQLVIGSAILQGVGYTISIAAIYLPPALLLRQRIVRLAKEAMAGHEAVEAETWLQQRGLQFRPLDELRQMGALLMPALISGLPLLMNF